MVPTGEPKTMRWGSDVAGSEVMSTLPTSTVDVITAVSASRTRVVWGRGRIVRRRGTRVGEKMVTDDRASARLEIQ